MKKYYKRKIDEELERWASSNERNPLLLRGARHLTSSLFLRHQIAHIENQWIMLFKWVTQGDASIFSITFVPCSYVRKSTAQVR